MISPQSKDHGSTAKMYALITGDTSGIGYEMARLFTHDGYNLIIAAREENGLQQKARELTKATIDVIPIAKIKNDGREPDKPLNQKTLDSHRSAPV